MAWSLHCDLYANLFESLKNILTSKDFIDRHKIGKTAFTRNRKLPFHLLACYLMNSARNSYQVELNHFFKALLGLDVARKEVSKAALSKRRSEMSHSAFIELNQIFMSKFQEMFKMRRWKGFRLLAIDGSTCRLPNAPEIAGHFGQINVKKGSKCAMARVSQIFDPLNKLSVASVITPIGVDERRHARELFACLKPSDLVLMDRGYAAFWIFKMIGSLGADFCARMSDKWNVAELFKASGEKERVVHLRPSGANIRQCRDMLLDAEPIPVRLLRVELITGEVEVLATSLLEKGRHPHDLFKSLYHHRWPVEEDYKAVKCWLQLENFSGKTVLSVYQDFHAKMLAKNITAALCFLAERCLKRIGGNGKWDRQINFAQALSQARNTVFLLFQRSRDDAKTLTKQLVELFLSATEPIRPDRNYPRNKKVSVRRFYVCYKAGA